MLRRLHSNRPTPRNRRVQAVVSACTALSIAFVTWPAVAQTPGSDAKPLRIVVPFAPGGARDVIGRYLGGHLSTRLGAPVVIENKAGVRNSMPFARPVRPMSTVH